MSRFGFLLKCGTKQRNFGRVCVSLQSSVNSSTSGSLLSRTHLCLAAQRKYSSNVPACISAWQIDRYGGTDELYLGTSKKLPTIRLPDEVLIEVHAASVNPIDTMMIGGYGAATLNPLRRVTCSLQSGSEFPLTLGRDFSGVVIDTSKAVPSSKFKPGDEVWGAISAQRSGTFSEYIVASALEISKKPVNITHTEAASIPYVAASTWSAVSTVGWMSPKSAKDKRVLLLGGSGGIGTFALQLLKAWGAHVTTTCATDAVKQVLALGADMALDYHTQNIAQELQTVGRFDFIFDCVGNDKTTYATDLLKSYSNATYVTLVVPFLENNDSMGLPFGLAKSVVTAGLDTMKYLREGKHYRWALFLPNGRAMAKVAQLVEQEKIRPVIEKVYSFDDVPNAFEKVMLKHNRGKTVVNVKDYQDLQETDETIAV